MRLQGLGGGMQTWRLRTRLLHEPKGAWQLRVRRLLCALKGDALPIVPLLDHLPSFCLNLHSLFD